MKNSLTHYAKKRNFKKTSEPKPTIKKAAKAFLHFCVQEHKASHLHYDFRLEHKGILLSWAIPKGPSMDPKTKRLAVKVEDHPLSYLDFEGEIPKGNYGAGSVLVWDIGYYEPLDDVKIGLKKGHLKFILQGEKLVGIFSLIKLKNASDNWLLIKSSDDV